MIYNLQKRFILISTVVVLAVIVLMLALIFTLNLSSMNRNIDMLADRVSDGRGSFPDNMGEKKPRDKDFSKRDKEFGFITPETPFSTRHFTVFFNESGEVAKTNTESIRSIDTKTAIEYAKKAEEDGEERGWISGYRYKVFAADVGKGVVFIDARSNLATLLQSMTVDGLVLLGCAALVLILIFFLSKKAVRPIAESYERQKQFITDANHELKTPLTLILTNLDIAEAELGKSEWLDDIRSEGRRMTGLVNQLVDLSRMDEECPLNLTEVAIGELVAETVAEFESLARERGKTLCSTVDQGIIYRGDEDLLRRLVGILMDNAIKYCDQGGEISVSLSRGRRVVLTVENTFADVKEIELNRLFDRFYRADKARVFTGSYGIGLSIAKAIAERHKGEIRAYKSDSKHIGFKVSL